MIYDDLRTATATAMRDERLQHAERMREVRRLRVEARARRREDRRVRGE